MSSLLPARAGGLSMLLLSLATSLACGGPPRLIHTHGPADHVPVGDEGEGEGDVAGEGEGDVVDNALPLVIRFREPGQHVVLNTQAGNTPGPLAPSTVDSADVPQPFSLDDAAAESALAASAHIDVDASETQIVVHSNAAFSVDHQAYAVGQAGPLPVEVCAIVDDDAAVVHITLRCEAALDVTGSGIAAVTAQFNNTDTYCNGVNLDGDTALIPFTSPTDVDTAIAVQNGEACFPVDLYAGANSDDEFAGSGASHATFTFAAHR